MKKLIAALLTVFVFASIGGAVFAVNQVPEEDDNAAHTENSSYYKDIDEPDAELEEDIGFSEITDEPAANPEVTEELTELPMETEKPTASPEAAEEPAESPEVTEEPTELPMETEEPTESPEVTEEPTENSEERPSITEEPSVTASPENNKETDSDKISREERLENKEAKLKSIQEMREMKELVKAAKIESLTYLKELRNSFGEFTKEDKKEVLAEIAAVKKELKDYSIDTFVNGFAIDYEKYDNVLPVIENGRTLAPVRAVTEALGAEVLWDGDTQGITITKDSTVITMIIGDKTAYVNGEAAALDTAPEIRNDRTIVPMRFIAESFGLNVDWDEESMSIIIE